MRAWSVLVVGAAVILPAACSSAAANLPADDIPTPAASTLRASSTTTTTTTVPPTTTTTSPSTTTTTTTTSTPPTSTTLPPEFAYSWQPVTAETVWATWREGCPLHWEALSLLTLTHWDFEGQVRTGEMVINTRVVEDVAAVFENLFDMGFPIERIELVDNYGGDDKAAMAANVTSGFNCRYVDGTTNWSNHALGLAVDINPLINPWARRGNVLPLEGEPYTDRSLDLPGMINSGDQAIEVFAELGWSWGGVWRSADYMHFHKPGG